MTDAILGIDVSKTTLDTSLLAGAKPRSRSFANSPDGWRQLIAWLTEHKIRQVHAFWKQPDATAWASRWRCMRPGTL